MGITMRDLGRMLGVSAVTVSKALSGKAGVSEEVRQKIIRLAEETGYINPKQPAKGLDIGILVPESFFSGDNFYAMFYKQLLQALTEAGHFGILELITADMQHDLVLPGLLRSDKVAALILLGQPSEPYTALLAGQHLPLLALDFHYPSIPMDAVVGDNIAGAAEMTRHLIAWGHRDIGFLGNVRATSSIMERYLGFASEMLRQGLSVRPECILLDRRDDNVICAPVLPEKLPTAFVCNCDIVARLFIEQLRSDGLRVPEDMSVVSFDDFNNVPGSLPLTTYRVDTAAMCRIAVERVTARCRGDETPPCRIVVGGEGVYRDSVSPIKNT
ncbi:MAG: LacI family transcriptional regulator [Clostridiales bacterium]|nr:LacI family transcriptional regulator [Clostridiales bacterium]